MSYKQYLFGPEAPFKTPKVEASELLPVEDFVIPNTEVDTPVDNANFYGVLVGVDSAEIVKTYLKISLTNTTGKVEAKIWGNKGINLEETANELKEMRLVVIDGKWNEFPKGSGRFSMIIENYEKADANPMDLIPKITESRNDLKNELVHYINKMSAPYSELALSILDGIWDYYSLVPAAKANHHSQLGGLLQHSVELLRIADVLLDQDYQDTIKLLDWFERMIQRARSNDFRTHRENPDAGRFFSVFYDSNGEYVPVLFSNYLKKLFEGEKPNRDVVTFSIIFHDVGKIMEYIFSGADKERYQLFFPGMTLPNSEESVGVDMDTNGVRLGHITLGMMFLQQQFIKNQVTDGKFVLDVLTSVSAHHGKKEWGSPTTPSTAEEYLVHIADLMDSKFASEK